MPCPFSSQEMSHSEVTESSDTRQVLPGSQQLNFNQEMMVSYSDNNLASTYENHQNETEEDFPRYTTKELRDHFEKTIEEAAPQKPIKVRVPRSELCTVCRRRAYPMDALIVDKKKYHKSCFCCEHCRNKLSLGNYVSLHGHLYCLPHYKQLLKSKGNYDDGLGYKGLWLIEL
uniref:LIM zinc-binding domain-containing protein n=1 Tax=Astatotilapia calliptera TaxID=8154 RepID=A0AAX7SE08_ASTCA